MSIIYIIDDVISHEIFYIKIKLLIPFYFNLFLITKWES